MTESAAPLDDFHDSPMTGGLLGALSAEHLPMLRQKRKYLIDHLDKEIHGFLLNVLPWITDKSLEQFDKAAQQAFMDTLPSHFWLRLQEQSEKSAQLCARYEKEYNVYNLADTLQEIEEKADRARLQRDFTADEVSLLEKELACLLKLNKRLVQEGIMPINSATYEFYAPATGIHHMMRLLSDSLYRLVRRELAPLEADAQTLPTLLAQYSEKQTELAVKEQAYEVLQDDTTRQRAWVEAYVEAWNNRMTDAEIANAVRSHIADLLHDANYRNYITTVFEKRFAESINPLFDQIAEIDQTIQKINIASNAKQTEETGY